MGLLSAQIESAKFSHISINKLLDGIKSTAKAINLAKNLIALAVALKLILVSYRKAVNFGNLNLIRHNVQANTVANVKAVFF